MKIAFLGLGNMGHAMAGRLIEAEHQLVVWNRTASRAAGLSAPVAQNPAEAVRDAQVAITMLSDDHALEAAVFGEGGILGAMPKNAIHVSMSTISVDLSRRMQEAHETHGQRYVSAPVFGRPEAAAAGKLFIVTAGPGAILKECEPLFSVMGQRTFVMGAEPSQANVIKLSGNFLIAAIIEVLGESVALTRKYGIDATAFVDFLTNSLFSAPIFKTYGGLIATEKFEPAGFKLRLGLKDIRLALQAADSAEVPLPIASLLHDHGLAAIAHGLGEKDWSSLSKIAMLHAGLK
jgi:3-hydroxyisobutyrate dehydrogenase-like beta-hydroxyacid dehydrogenase